MITTGVVGQRWRASVTPWGGVEPWDGAPELDWFVAADDRWHVPRDEAAVRQSRVDGTPVVETRVRVPSGDVVQTIYSCADAGGVTVVDVANESSLPVALAFNRRDVLTERPIADIPIEGIELPAGSFVMPLGHRARARIALAHSGSGGGAVPALPTAAQVTRGWLALAERAGRFVLPEAGGGAGLARQIVAARCELVLAGPADPGEDPALYVFGAGELVRLGEARSSDMVEVVAAAVEAIALDARWESAVALSAALRLMEAAGETRAVRDIERIMKSRGRSTSPGTAPDGLLAVAWLESKFASNGQLFPEGIPAAWRGVSIEAYGVPTGPASTIALALRWHGARPALLWEQHGPPVLLTAPGWTSREPAGEVLWPAPTAEADSGSTIVE
jgi:hypothetical protein